MEKQHLQILEWTFGGIALLFALIWLFATVIPEIYNIGFDLGYDHVMQTLQDNFLNILSNIFLNTFFILMIVFIIPSAIFSQLRAETEHKTISKRVPAQQRARIPQPQPHMEQQAPAQTTIKETVIKEKVKVYYALPDQCPSCRAKISQNTVKWAIQFQAICPYCNIEIKLIEKEM